LTNCIFEINKKNQEFPLYVASVTECHASIQQLKFFKQNKGSIS